MEEILRAIGRSDEAKPFVRLTLDSAAGAGHGRMSFRRVGSGWLGYSGRAEKGECAQGRSNEGYPTKFVTLTRPGHKRITTNQQRQGRRRMAGPLATYSQTGAFMIRSMLGVVVLWGALLVPTESLAQTPCTRAELQAAVDSYLAAQAKGVTSTR